MTTTPPCPAPSPDPRGAARVTFDYFRMLLSGLAAGAYTDQDVLDRMREAVHRPVADETTGDLRPWPRDFSELRSSGLLWLINRQVLHPWGCGTETSNVAAALATLGLVRA